MICSATALLTSADGIILALVLDLLQILQTIFCGWDDVMTIIDPLHLVRFPFSSFKSKGSTGDKRPVAARYYHRLYAMATRMIASWLAFVNTRGHTGYP
jgi:hypothetical protein